MAAPVPANSIVMFDERFHQEDDSNRITTDTKNPDDNELVITPTNITFDHKPNNYDMQQHQVVTGLSKLLTSLNKGDTDNFAQFNSLNPAVQQQQQQQPPVVGQPHHQRRSTESTMSSSPPEISDDRDVSSSTTNNQDVMLSSSHYPSQQPMPIGSNKTHQQHSATTASTVGAAYSPSLSLTPNSSSAVGTTAEVVTVDTIAFPSITTSAATATNNSASFVDSGGLFLYPHANSSISAAFQSHIQQQQQDGNGSVSGSVIRTNTNPSTQNHHHHHQRGESSSFGSFDLSYGGNIGTDDDDDGNDGLFGLDALHYRASSTAAAASDGLPALTSSTTSSPRVVQRRQTYHHPSGSDSLTPPSSLLLSQQQQRRTSIDKKDRPPLSSSQQYGSVPTSSAMGGYDATSPPTTNATITEFGTIGQILRQNAVEFDPTRRRASSSEYYSSNTTSHNTSSDLVAQKFGTLPTLSSHMQQLHQQQQQQGSNSNNSVSSDGVYGTSSTYDLSKPRHNRSISQPIPPGMGGIGSNQDMMSTSSSQQRYYNPSMTAGGSSSKYDGKGSTNSPGLYSSISTSRLQEQQHQQQYRHHLQGGSMSSYDSMYGGGNSSLKNSNTPYGQNQGSGGYNNPYSSGGSDALEHGFDNFHINSDATSASSGINYIGAYNINNGESSYSGRSGRRSSSNSPGPNSIPYFYGTDASTNVSGGSSGNNPYHHIRHQSDNGLMVGGSNSSQLLPNLGLSSSLPRLDDDYGHHAVLAGENIDVLDNDELQQGLPPYFLPTAGGGGSHPLQRGPTHAHSMSMDALQSQQYMQQSIPKVVYAVKFKRSQRNFILGPRINRDLKIGTYVKVEADRGEDLGIIVGKLPPEKFNNTFSSRSSFTAGMGPSSIGSSLEDLKRIMRLATHDEVSLLGLKREEEEELLKICRTKVRQRGLPMNVIDAEYQFDRHKLTFFFEAMGRVDFRELVRDLFSMYKTRIWMQQLDKNTSTSAQAMIYPTANLQLDYGTPIIAPTSEFADSIMYGQNPNINMSLGETDYD